jgi:hypothetical protein
MRETPSIFQYRNGNNLKVRTIRRKDFALCEVSSETTRQTPDLSG